MKKIFFSISIIFFCSVNFLSQSNVTKEEYAVYARILRDIRLGDLKNNKAKYSFVILEDTFKSDSTNEYENKKLRGLTQNFKQKNQTSSKLKKLFPVNYEYEVVGKSEIDEFLKTGEKELESFKTDHNLRKQTIVGGSDITWKPFYENYPNSNGYYQFSRVGFSSDKSFALVFVEGKGASWSSTAEYVLRKVKGKWIIYFSGGGFSIA